MGAGVRAVCVSRAPPWQVEPIVHVMGSHPRASAATTLSLNSGGSDFGRVPVVGFSPPVYQ